MAEEDFNKDDLLSIGDLLKDRLRSVNEASEKLDKAIKELEDLPEVIRRRELFLEFLEDFCAPHTENSVWFELLKGGGKYYVLELPPFLHISVSNLYKILDKLFERGLVKTIGKQYQAVSPEEFIRKKRTQKHKSKEFSKIEKNQA